MAMRISEAVLSGVGTWRDYKLHQEREKLESNNHNNEMKLMKDYHLQEENLAKQIYLVEKFTEIEQHFQQLNADLLTVSKESERDMFDQRNQQFSTILVATTIVLSGLITVLIQGVLPPGSSNFLQIVYAISNSGSMALLFICSVLCLEVIWRASQFMYERSKVHTNDLGNAIKETKKMMRKVRGIKAYEMASLERPKSRRHISGMSDDEIMKEFAQHENEVQNYLRQRQKIIDKAAYMVFSEDGTSIENESFSHFWRDSCGYYSNAAILFFYGGSALLFVATMTYMWARYDYVLNSPVAAQVSVYLISFALLASMALVIYLRYYDKQYLDGKEKFELDNRKAEIRLNKADAALSEPLDIPLPGPRSTPRRSYFNHRDMEETKDERTTGRGHSNHDNNCSNNNNNNNNNNTTSSASSSANSSGNTSSTNGSNSSSSIFGSQDIPNNSTNSTNSTVRADSSQGPRSDSPSLSVNLFSIPEGNEE